jgi:sugar phosphate isomerase/epimerase
MMVSYHPSLAGRPTPSWKESVRIAGDAGFEFIDLDLSEVADVDPAALREKLGVGRLRPGASSLPVELRADDAAFNESLGFLRSVAPLASGIGVRVMHRSLPASSDTPFSELWPVLQRRWSECAAVLREHDILVAVEPLGTPYRRREGVHEFICRLDMAADFAVACGEGVGVLVDSWHWHLSGASASDIVDLGELIVHAHVADVPELPAGVLRDDERLPPGEGMVDFDAFFGALAVTGYEGLVSPEVPGSWSEGLDTIEAARRVLESTLWMAAGAQAPGRTPIAPKSSGGGGGGGTCRDAPAGDSPRLTGFPRDLWRSE